MSAAADEGGAEVGPAPAEEAPGAEPDAEPPRVVLYRCPTPTNVLCPCGAVERRLRKLGIEHRTERVPYRKRDRPEIEELTGQQRVPLLIDDDQVVYDSKRILEYLEWRFGADADQPDPEPSAPGATE